MLMDCPVLGNKQCPFCTLIGDALYCGLGKGSSELKDIKSCNGKDPRYDQKDIYQENIRRKKEIHRTGIRDKTRDLFRGTEIRKQRTDDL